MKTCKREDFEMFRFGTLLFGVTLIICAFADGPIGAKVILGLMTLFCSLGTIKNMQL